MKQESATIYSVLSVLNIFLFLWSISYISNQFGINSLRNSLFFTIRIVECWDDHSYNRFVGFWSPF